MIILATGVLLGVAYDIENPGWDGLSDLAAMARRAQVVLKRDCDPATSARLILYPTANIDPFLIAASSADLRMVVLDDFGTVVRGREGADVGAREYWQGSPDFPVARAARGHPVVHGVRAVVFNRAGTLTAWKSDAAILEFAPGRPAVVASGNVVIGADPSVLVNRMLRFADNARFARNILRWLSLGGRAPVCLMVGDEATRAARAAAMGRLGAAWRKAAGLVSDVNMELSPTGFAPEAGSELAIAVAALAAALWAVFRAFGTRTRSERRAAFEHGGRRGAARGATVTHSERLRSEVDDAWLGLRVRLMALRRSGRRVPRLSRSAPREGDERRLRRVLAELDEVDTRVRDAGGNVSSRIQRGWRRA